MILTVTRIESASITVWVAWLKCLRTNIQTSDFSGSMSAGSLDRTVVVREEGVAELAAVSVTITLRALEHFRLGPVS